MFSNFNMPSFGIVEGFGSLKFELDNLADNILFE